MATHLSRNQSAGTSARSHPLRAAGTSTSFETGATLFESTEDCPSDIKMAAYIDGTLSFPERYLLEEHLMDCFRCSEIAVSHQIEQNQEIEAVPPEILERAQWEFGGGLMRFGDFVADLLEKHPVADGKTFEQWFVSDIKGRDDLKKDIISYVLALHFCQEDKVELDEELEIGHPNELVNLAFELNGFAISLISFLGEAEHLSTCEDLRVRMIVVSDTMNNRRVAIRHQEAIRRFRLAPHWNVQIVEIE